MSLLFGFTIKIQKASPYSEQNRARLWAGSLWTFIFFSLQTFPSILHSICIITVKWMMYCLLKSAKIDSEKVQYVYETFIG